jgi:hypothetical protein
MRSEHLLEVLLNLNEVTDSIVKQNHRKVSTNIFDLVYPLRMLGEMRKIVGP